VIVAHSLELDVGRAGDALGRATSAARVDQRVTTAMNDERGHLHVAEGVRTRAVAHDGADLAADAGRAEASVVGGCGASAVALVVLPFRLRPVDGQALHVVLDVLVARRGGR